MELVNADIRVSELPRFSDSQDNERRIKAAVQSVKDRFPDVMSMSPHEVQLVGNRSQNVQFTVVVYSEQEARRIHAYFLTALIEHGFHPSDNSEDVEAINKRRLAPQGNRQEPWWKFW